MLARDVALTMTGTLLFTALIPVAIAAAVPGHLSSWLIAVPVAIVIVLAVAWSIWLAAGPRYRPAPDHPSHDAEA